MAAFLRAPSLESILQHCRQGRGLYVVGAGGSAGLAPIGNGFYRILALDWWRNGGGVRPDIPAHRSPLNQKIIESQMDCPQYEIWGREIRPGTEPYPAKEILQRLPEYGTRLRAMHELVRKRHEGWVADSYGIFRAFRPGIILNYNHDGFASQQCGRHHRVIAAHGTIDPWFGSPDVERLISIVRDYDLVAPPDELIMCEHERHDDAILKRRLELAGSVEPDFIAVIGYSFAKVGDIYDDYVSLEWFKRRFRRFSGNIFVISPFPEDLRYMIADVLKSDNVFGVRAYWNVLAHAFAVSIRYPGRDGSIYATHERLLSVWGDRVVFPRQNCTD